MSAYENPFVEPQTKRVPIPGREDDWLEVKLELPYGEERRLSGSALGDMSVDSERDSTTIGMAWGLHTIERMLSWIVDWSLKGPDGKDVLFNLDGINMLKVSMGEAIDQALDAHIGEVEDGGADPNPPAAIEITATTSDEATS